jgi:AcrR family transcriptional regulator
LKRKGAGYHHGDLRRALVEATIRLVDARGTEGFTLRAAAQLAGVSDGAPYHHFEDKDALLASVAEESFQFLLDEMAAAAEKQRGNVRKKSLAMGVAYVLFAARHPARFRLMFGPLVHDRRRFPDLAAAAQRTNETIQAAFAEGLTEAGAMRNRSASRPLLLSAWSLVHGLSVLAVEGYLGEESSNIRRLERLTWSAVSFLEPESPRDGSEGAPSSRQGLRADRTHSPPLGKLGRG